MHSPRILFAAPASGSGKTTIVCGILRALKNRGNRVSAFKCGPDYIDPMFHERVVGVKSGTLDLFFSDANRVRLGKGYVINESALTTFAQENKPVEKKVGEIEDQFKKVASSEPKQN